MKLGFVYGGQGSQLEGIGHELYKEYPIARKIYNKIGEDMKRLSFFGHEEEISKTSNTQNILIAFQIVVTEILRDYGLRPSIMMGLSLGEYGALYGSGVLNFYDVLSIVKARSTYMSEIEGKVKSRMMAVFTDDIDLLEEICEDVSSTCKFIEISNINTKKQCVLSGDKDAILAAKDRLMMQGIRFLEINTSGPFHTSYMDEVSISLGLEFKKFKFKREEIPIIYNYLGDFNRKNMPIDEIMSKQVNNRVLFRESLEKLLEQDLDLIVEIGHKDIIKGFIRKINRNTRVMSVNSVESIRELLKEVDSFGK